MSTLILCSNGYSHYAKRTVNVPGKPGVCVACAVKLATSSPLDIDWHSIVNGIIER